MPILTKAQLEAENQASFPDNNSNYITPEILRNYNTDVIDTLVDSNDTGSFARTDLTNTFTQTNNFTAISASSFVSASNFIGDGSRLTNITSSIALPILDEGVPVGNAVSMNFSGSAISAYIAAGVAIVSVNALDSASFNAYTASNDAKVNSLIAKTGSYATTGSNNFIGDQHIDGDLYISGTNFIDIGEGSFRIVDAGNDITLLDAQNGVQLRNFTTNDIIVEQFANSAITIDNNSGSVNINAHNLGQGIYLSASVISLNNIDFNSYSSSVGTTITDLDTSASLALYTASFDNGTRNLTFTKGDNATFSVNIPDVSGSTDYTTTASFNEYTQSNDAKVNSLIDATGSYATTGSNSFNGNQTITGSLNIRNITTFTDVAETPSTLNVGTGTLLIFLGNDINGNAKPNIFDIANVNGVGWSMSGSGITDGIVTSAVYGDGQIEITITSGNVVSGSSYIGVGPFAPQLIVTGSVFSSQGFVSPNGIIVQNQDGTGVQYGSMGINNAGALSTDIFSTMYVGNGTPEGQLQFGVSSYTPMYSGEPVPTFYAGGNYDAGLGYGSTDTTMTFYSSSIQVWHPIQFKTPNAPIEVTGSINITNQLTTNLFTASLQNGYAWVGGSNGKNKQVLTSSFSGGGTIATGSLMRTGSVSGNVLTFTKGDATTFSLTVATGSSTTIPAGTVSSSAQILNYGIFATTGSNSFRGNQTITGSLIQSGAVSIQGNTTFVNKNGATDNVILGLNAMVNITGSVVSSVAIGDGAMRYASGTQQNVALGKNTLSMTIGTNNVAVGNEALANNTTGTQNMAMGVGAMNQNSTGGQNVAIGNDALFQNYSSSYNVAIGTNALSNNLTEQNVAIGGSSLRNTTLGDRNTAFGYSSMYQNITGKYNTAIGSFALYSATSSVNTIAIGVASMENAENSDENIAIGVASLYRKKANSNSNVAIGTHALREHFDGDINSGQNISIGYDAMRYVTSGSANTAIGVAALRDAPKANENVFIGYRTGLNAGQVDYNTVIGARAGSGIKSNYNTIIGHQAANAITSGSSNTIIGQNAANAITSGSSNTIIGQAAGAEVRGGSGNTFIGYSAGYNTSGSNNTFIGTYQGIGNESGVITLSDGAQNLRAIYSGSLWSMKAPVNFTTGSNQQAGTATLDGGNPGTVTVSNSLVTANSIILLTKQTLNHPQGQGVSVTSKGAGTFTIASNHNGDTDTVGWFIINNS